jgi:hypothetical protein
MSDQTKDQVEISGPIPGTMAENVRKCPNGADGRFTPAAQVPAGLSDAQQRAVWLLITGTSFAQVARECGVDARTIYRWRYECEPFRAELARVRRQQWDHVADRLRGLVITAFDVLSAEIVDEYDRSRVRAAGMVLRTANVRKLIEDELTERDE